MDSAILKKFSQKWSKYWYCLIILMFITLYVYSLFKNISDGQYITDYLAFWSAGKVANEAGYSSIYDSNLLESAQLDVLYSLGFQEINFDYFPFPNLSIFVIPFQLLSMISFLPSYWIWTIINWIFLIGYFFYFIRQITPKSRKQKFSSSILFALLFSFPTFNNYSWGQIDALLFICAGEIIRNSIQRRQFTTGIWIGLLVLKPQLIVLIIPSLLIQRSFPILKGAIVSGSLLTLSSLFISGTKGFVGMIKLWLGFLPGMASNFPEGMMNWRMVGLRFNEIFQNNLGWIIIVIGVLVTLFYYLLMIKKNPEIGSSEWVIVYMGVLTATCSMTWHSHVHMAMIIIPFLIFGFLNEKIPTYLIHIWVSIPLMMLLILGLILAFKYDIYSFDLLKNGHGFLAPFFLLFNMIICYVIVKLPNQIKM